jgi:hypothetical protein
MYSMHAIMLMVTNLQYNLAGLLLRHGVAAARDVVLTVLFAKGCGTKAPAR